MSLELQLKSKVFIYKGRSEVTIGKTTWKTSIFPESKDGAFLLLLKAEVRKKENIKAGDMVSFTLGTLI